MTIPSNSTMYIILSYGAIISAMVYLESGITIAVKRGISIGTVIAIAIFIVILIVRSLCS